MTLPPMLQRTYDTIASSGRMGRTLEEIAYTIGWWEPGHGPLSGKTVHEHIRRLRKRGIAITVFLQGNRALYRLASALPLAACPTCGGAVDLLPPLQRTIARELLGRQPGHFHDDAQPIRGHMSPLTNGMARDTETLGNGVHHAALSRDLLQSDAAGLHSNLISTGRVHVKRLTRVKCADKQRGKEMLP